MRQLLIYIIITIGQRCQHLKVLAGPDSSAPPNSSHQKSGPYEKPYEIKFPKTSGLFS